MESTIKHKESKLTFISALIDTSGSMREVDTSELASEVNDLIKKSRENSEKVIFNGAKFSSTFNMFSDNVDGEDVNIDATMITPSGATALKSSFARMIRHTAESIDKLTEKPDNIIFMLLSDGEETTPTLHNRIESDEPYEGLNATSNIKKLVSQYQNEFGWVFYFIGTNFDAISVGKDFGVDPKTCMNYKFSTGGVTNALRAVSQGINRSQTGNDTGFTNDERSASAML